MANNIMVTPLVTPLPVVNQISSQPAANDSMHNTQSYNQSDAASARQDNNSSSGNGNSFRELISGNNTQESSLKPAQGQKSASDNNGGNPGANNNVVTGNNAGDAGNKASAANTGGAVKATSDKVDIAKVILLAQPQISDYNKSIGSSSGNQVDTNTLSAQDQNLLQQLQQLLQKLLQLANSVGSNTQPVATAPARNNPSGDNKHQDMPNAGDSNALAQMMSQLLALLQQISKQPDMKALSAQLNTLAVSGDGQTATNVLTQLAQSLQNQLGETTGNTKDNSDTDAGDNVTGAASSRNQPSNPFDKIINALLESANNNATPVNPNGNNAANTKGNNSDTSANNNVADKLQAALSSIIQTFSSAIQDARQGLPVQPANPLNKDVSGNNVPETGQVVPNIIHNNTLPAANMVKFSTAVQPQTPVSEQVLVQIKNANEGTSQIRIQLDPANLGKVEVQMNTGSDGKTTITITSDNRQTMAMLQNEAKSLEASLRDVGIRTSDSGLNFNLSQQQGGNNQGSANNGGYTNVVQASDPDDDINFGTINASYKLTVNTGLDIRV